MADAVRELADRIRDQLIGALHIGDLQEGDRLPSIREVARRVGADQRRVARAYRRLATEGLVEVRGRSGVYAASPPRPDTEVLEDPEEWLAHVLVDGWSRRIPIGRLPDLIREHSTRAPVRCALLECCEDAMEAFRHDL